MCCLDGPVCLRVWPSLHPATWCPHLILELLAELQGDGEEDEGIIEPRDHRLHFVDVAHLQTLGTPLAVGRGEGP